jgi:molybdate transport system substrate-binding protein
MSSPVRIVAVGAVKLAVQRLLAAPGLPEAEATFDTVGAARDRVLAGEPCDLVMVSTPAMDALQGAGRISGPRHVIGRTGAAFAVPKGTAPPDLATEAAVAAALRAAPVIAMADPASGATAGRHFWAVLQRLGLAEELGGKLTRHPNGMLAVAEVAAGRAAIAISQGTEILAAPGVALGGMLPESLQLWTAYEAARGAGGDPRAQAFLDLFASETGRAAFAGIGFIA